jgi:hypothetical protein
MEKLSLTDEQVIEFVKKLPPKRKRAVLFALAEETEIK